jgi:hypothetical protein
LTYELYYDSQVATSSKAAQLEARLAALEAAIGPVPYEEVRARVPPLAGRRAYRRLRGRGAGWGRAGSWA